MAYFSALVINLLPILLFLLVLAALVLFRFGNRLNQRRALLIAWAAFAVLLLLLDVVVNLNVPIAVFALNVGPTALFLILFGGLLLVRRK